MQKIILFFTIVTAYQDGFWTRRGKIQSRNQGEKLSRMIKYLDREV